MTTLQSIYLSAAFEIGVFVALGLLAWLKPAWRRRTVVVLGALTPLLMFLAVTSVRHLVFANEEAGFIFLEIWITSFLPYVACLVFGMALSFLRRPVGLSARYILGLLPTAALAVAIALAWPQ